MSRLAAVPTSGRPLGGDCVHIDVDIFVADKVAVLKSSGPMGGDCSFTDARIITVAGKAAELPPLNSGDKQLASFGFLPSQAHITSGQATDAEHCFAAGFTVPQVPRGEVSTLAATAFCVLLSAPACARDIGNAVLRFLDREVEATVLKARPEKFWWGANIALGSDMVRVKARIWERRSGEYVLELQRRRGSVVAFNKIYHKFLAFFLHNSNFRILTKEGQSVCLRVDSDDEAGLGTPPLQPLVAGGSGQAGGPGAASLFAMMLCTSMASLLVDVFRALVGLFGQRPDLLLSEEFVRNVKSLMTDRFPADPEAQLALADLLAQAARNDRFNERLVDEGMWPLLADKLCTNSVDFAAKKRFTCAIEGAAKKGG